MDTHALQETGDNIKRTQYFNILTYDWEQMSRDREERVLLICDEAYLMIDRSVPQSLVYLRNVMKRARKYEAALGLSFPTALWTFCMRASSSMGRHCLTSRVIRF